MKTKAYVIREDQIQFVKEMALQAGDSSDSAAMRSILDESMQKHCVACQGRDGELHVDPSIPKTYKPFISAE